MDDELPDQIAVAVVVGALAQAVVALAQLVGVTLGGLAMRRQFSLVYGNVGQANHFSDLLWLGMAALVYLSAKERIKPAASMVFIVLLAFCSAASASRRALGYSTLFGAIGLVLCLCHRERRQLGQWALFCATVTAAVQLMVSGTGVLALFSVTNAAERFSDAGSNGQRLNDWAIAWDAIRAHSWFGSGPGSFYRLSVGAALTGPEKSFPVLAENAHNIVLQLATEFGVVGAVLILGPVAFIGVRGGWVAIRDNDPVRLFALLGLGVLGIHSMIEYPLWYTYFLVPAALLLGLLNGGDGPQIRVPAWVLRGAGILGIGILVWVSFDWYCVRQSEIIWSKRGRDTTVADRDRIEALAANVTGASFFANEARNYELKAWLPDSTTAAHMAARCDERWKILPDWTVMIQCAQAYGVTGQEQKLNDVMTVLCRGFPKHHALLRQWIEASPDIGGLPLGGRACLAPRQSVS